MNTSSKYKLFYKQILDVVPSRVLKFKSTKWQKPKKIAEAALASSTNNIAQTYGVFVSSKALPKTKSYFNDCLMTNVIFKQFFSSRAHVNFNSKKLPKEFDLFFNKVFIKQLFRPEVLLSKLNFFNSIDEAIKSVENGSVLINFKKKKPNYFLKKGDVITLDTSFFAKNVLNTKFFLNKSLFSFVEIDFFTNTIIILKDDTDMCSNDINLLISFFFNIQHLKDFK